MDVIAIDVQRRQIDLASEVVPCGGEALAASGKAFIFSQSDQDRHALAATRQLDDFPLFGLADELRQRKHEAPAPPPTPAVTATAAATTTTPGTIAHDAQDLLALTTGAVVVRKPQTVDANCEGWYMFDEDGATGWCSTDDKPTSCVLELPHRTE